jgi:muramoyltetrapeptide carboxypeptidase
MFRIFPNHATFGIVSPAYVPVESRVLPGIKYLEQKGFRIKKGQYLESRHGYFAGTEDDRVKDLHEMYRDKEVDIILCTRGGWGGLRLVDKLDYKLIKKNPKPLIGYSDITTLQLAIWSKTKVPSFSGPMLAVEMGKGIDAFTEEHFWQQLQNPGATYTFNFSPTNTQILRSGQARGKLVGGCLSMVTSLLGTPYSPDYRGVILFIEDTGEKPYRIDRYLAHLKQAGVFEQISGLILGEFTDCIADAGEISFTLSEIFEQYFGRVDFPVVTDFPYGHGDVKMTMPIGLSSILDTEERTLQVENPFRLPGLLP